MLTGVTPSVYVKSQGPVPVNAIVTSGIGSPEQIVPPPLTTAVGRGAVVIVAEPLEVPVHKASFRVSNSICPVSSARYSIWRGSLASNANWGNSICICEIPRTSAC